MELVTRQVNLPVGTDTMGGYLAQPAHAGPFPAVIVLMEIFGVNGHIRDVTERLAREGYVVLAIDYFHRTAPGLELGYSEADIARGRVETQHLSTMTLLADLEAAIRYLQSSPEVTPGRIGVIGFCYGGHVAYIAAGLPQVQATASFYGRGIAQFGPGGDPPTVSRTPMIRGSIALFFGDEDASIPLDQVQFIERTLQQSGVDYQLHRYASAGHGFFCDRRDSYHPEAAADSWEKIKTFFAAKLS